MPPAPPQIRAPKAAAPAASSNGAAAPTTNQPIAIRKAGDDLPARIMIFAVEGWGKTTLGAYSPKPIFLMSGGETGIDTLRQHGLVPDVDAFDPCLTWQSVMDSIDYLIANDTGHRTLVLDAMGGFERLCHEHVCIRNFNGDWSDKGFFSFMRGYDQSIPEWITLLQKLDRLRLTRRMAVMVLAHSRIRDFKNPDGGDFSRYVSDVHEKTWGVTHKWCDAVLFGNFFTVVVEENGRKKGKGGIDRVLYTQHRDTFDAKNRYGMEPIIDMPDQRELMWETLSKAIKDGQKESA